MARIMLGTRSKVVAAVTAAMAAGVALIPLSSASAASGTEVGLGGGVTLLASANASYECPRIHTTDHYAYTWCRVYSGRVRLIADCVRTPDLASNWIYRKDGNPTQRLQAGPCVVGIGPNSGIHSA
ncbi:hypothetical protein [Streptomyces spirodelae]|uniref:Secreted protein n=1 Tax=Streptomyces spirodelae TaxID=2812904 RepID=A0ABS3WM27_9ACTN|nr:hypothetical protein [Streptomyces spirodelae]MBO8183922.1 hypothetical protein [Streptomyces spirodelae]